MAEQLTDQALVERVQQGDKKAFNLLVSRYQNKVAGLLTRYISHNDIPDVVQESFIKAYRSIESFGAIVHSTLGYIELPLIRQRIT